MTLHLGLHHNRNAEQQAEIREARRMLQGRVRNDWDYPPLPAYQDSQRERKPQQQENSEATVAGFKFHAPQQEEQFEPLEWRERDYASSDDNSDEDEVEIAAVRGAPGKKGKGEHKEEALAVAQQISNRRLARKRKRKELLEEEMAWNDGLSHWTVRRDAWCGAKTADQVRSQENERAEEGVHAKPDSGSASAGSTPRTSTSSGSALAASTSTVATSPDANINIAGMSVVPPSHMLVPVAPKMLPNHPIRKKISPGMYSEIYAKIIIQSRTPSVPINLGVMIPALVKGWIDDGEWPPKPGPIEKSITKKKAHGVKDGVKSFARVLRITGGESVTGKD